MAIDVNDIRDANDTRRTAYDFEVEDNIFRSQEFVEVQIFFHEKIAAINLVVNPTEKSAPAKHLNTFGEIISLKRRCSTEAARFLANGREFCLGRNVNSLIFREVNLLGMDNVGIPLFANADKFG